MVQAITDNGNVYSLHKDVVANSISAEFIDVCEGAYKKLMMIFGQYALPYEPHKQKVKRIGLIGKPGSGKTESCQWMKDGFADIKQLTNQYFPKGQGEWFHEQIGMIRQYDAAATDYDICLPAYDDYEYWKEEDKHGVDMAEHADLDYVDKEFMHILLINKVGVCADSQAKRSVIIYTDREEADTSEYINCITKMHAQL